MKALPSERVPKDDYRVHSYACIALLFVGNAYKTRLAVNRFVCSRCQMVSKL